MFASLLSLPKSASWVEVWTLLAPTAFGLSTVAFSIANCVSSASVLFEIALTAVIRTKSIGSSRSLITMDRFASTASVPQAISARQAPSRKRASLLSSSFTRRGTISFSPALKRFASSLATSPRTFGLKMLTISKTSPVLRSRHGVPSIFISHGSLNWALALDRSCFISCLVG